MSVDSVLKKALKAGYYVASFNACEYASTEREALKIVDSLDKMGRDAVVYRYRDGVFRRCLVVDLEKLMLSSFNVEDSSVSESQSVSRKD